MTRRGSAKVVVIGGVEVPTATLRTLFSCGPPA